MHWMVIRALALLEHLILVGSYQVYDYWRAELSFWKGGCLRTVVYGGVSSSLRLVLLGANCWETLSGGSYEAYFGEHLEVCCINE